MRRIAPWFGLLLVLTMSLLAFAGSPRSYTVSSSGGVGADPSSVTAGVSISDATAIRVRASSYTGTITGGSLCAFYLPADGGAAGWQRNKGLDLTIPATSRPDGGTVTSVTMPDISVVGGFGRVAFIACGITGTATDAGTNTYNVTTESWGPNYP